MQFNQEDESATLTPDGKTLRLPQVPAASGAKYSDGNTILWTKGKGAFIEIDHKMVVRNCTTEQ